MQKNHDDPSISLKVIAYQKILIRNFFRSFKTKSKKMFFKKYIEPFCIKSGKLEFFKKVRLGKLLALWPLHYAKKGEKTKTI